MERGEREVFVEGVAENTANAVSLTRRERIRQGATSLSGRWCLVASVQLGVHKFEKPAADHDMRHKLPLIFEHYNNIAPSMGAGAWGAVFGVMGVWAAERLWHVRLNVRQARAAVAMTGLAAGLGLNLLVETPAGEQWVEEFGRAHPAVTEYFMPSTPSSGDVVMGVAAAGLTAAIVAPGMYRRQESEVIGQSFDKPQD